MDVICKIQRVETCSSSTSIGIKLHVNVCVCVLFLFVFCLFVCLFLLLLIFFVCFVCLFCFCFFVFCFVLVFVCLVFFFVFSFLLSFAQDGSCTYWVNINMQLILLILQFRILNGVQFIDRVYQGVHFCKFLLSSFCTHVFYKGHRFIKNNKVLPTLN